MDAGDYDEGPMTEETKRISNVVSTKVNLASNAIAGTIAGFTSSVLTHPLDVVKTRFQVHDGRASTVPKYRSTLSALVTIGRTEGIRTLYAGLAPNLVGSTVSWGSYFYAYNYMRGYARGFPEFVDSHGQTGPLINMSCAMLAGMCTCLATNPIWLVKTRLQLQHGVSVEHRLTMTGMFSRVIRDEGFAGLYRGLVPSMMLTSHGALQFMAYEEIKKVIISYANDGDEHLSTIQTLFTATVSKTFASLVTYPSQVLRSRLQQADPAFATADPSLGPSRERYFKGTWDVFTKTL
eukprot:CAMPEP_0113663372 /NCGR_PEP_ID=MMETSP0038_2-20120614/1106_1 /TAXON_ID=2898 /ORGANISM="Cryptomonas paramecium" /LENGTH=292 /DNA_ID=CAMNT_0000578393 /DNA_START=59 /DNA_END=934 /DNA_ORIENTATION=- /assembly_acc=CAM_ASM_000170